MTGAVATTAEFPQTAAEGVELRGVERRRYGLQHANPIALPRLLRPRHERPRSRTADQRDKFSPLQLTELHPLPLTKE